MVALVNRGVLRIPFALEPEAEAIARLLRRYQTLPMSVADACLVRMSRSRVFTTDLDFAIYRRNGRQVVPLLAPPDVAGHHGARNSSKRKTGDDEPGHRDLLAPKLRATATSSRSNKTT